MSFRSWGGSNREWGGRRESTRRQSTRKPSVLDKPSTVLNRETDRFDGGDSSVSEGLLAGRTTSLNPVDSTAKSKDFKAEDLATGRTVANTISNVALGGAITQESKSLLGLSNVAGTAAGILGGAYSLSQGKPIEGLAQAVGTVVPSVALAYGAYTASKALYGSWKDGVIGDVTNSRTNESTRDIGEDFGLSYNQSEAWSKGFGSFIGNDGFAFGPQTEEEDNFTNPNVTPSFREWSQTKEAIEKSASGDSGGNEFGNTDSFDSYSPSSNYTGGDTFGPANESDSSSSNNDSGGSYGQDSYSDDGDYGDAGW